MNGSGMNSSIARPIATARPEKTTARPAVSIVRTIASSVSSVSRELLAEAVDDEQRVVDGDAEPDQLHEVREYVAISIWVATIQMSPSVPMIVTPAKRNGIKNARRPNAQHEQQERDRHGDVRLALLQVVGEDRVEVVLDRRLPGEIGPRSGELPDGGSHLLGAPLRASAGSSEDTIDAVSTSSPITRAPTNRPVGSSAAARRPAAATSSTRSAAAPSVFTTSVNEPTDR